MSNRRKPHSNGYRTGYLRSPAWFARRTRWFTAHLDEHGYVTCAGCGIPATARELELHHADYSGVTTHGERWVAGEADDDLIPLHPRCHELLHRLIERDPVLARHRTRRDATALSLAALQPSLHASRNGEAT